MKLTRDEKLTIGNALNAEAARLDLRAERYEKFGINWQSALVCRQAADRNRELTRRLIEAEEVTA